MANYQFGYYGRPGYGPDERKKTSHAPDHECRPVLVDTEGRKRPIIVVPGNTETYVTRTETYVEEIYSSSEDEYHHSYTTKYEPVKHYGHPHEKGNRCSSPARDRPAGFDEFLTKIQTEASQPIKCPPSPTYRLQNHHLGVRDGFDSDSGRHSDYNKKIPKKPSGYATRHNKHHDAYDSDYGEYDSDDEPHMKTSRSWGKPTNGVGTKESKAKGTHGWSNANHGTRDATRACDGRLSAPMNDIEKAIEYFKEAVNIHPGKTAPNSKNKAPALDFPKRGGYTEIIDSSEAKRRYGNFRPSLPGQETYSTTIDSRKAAMKYNGTTV